MTFVEAFSRGQTRAAEAAKKQRAAIYEKHQKEIDEFIATLPGKIEEAVAAGQSTMRVMTVPRRDLSDDFNNLKPHSLSSILLASLKGYGLDVRLQTQPRNTFWAKFVLNLTSRIIRDTYISINLNGPMYIP
jgi:hypothetical protein